MLLVTIDTWRWDHVGASGRGRVATPHLDRLAAEGTYLPRVQTTCPLTTPAHATILTGLTPRAHGIHDNQHFALAPGVTTLAERFRDAGYDTGAFVSGAPLRRAYGLDRGFGTYDDQGLVVTRADPSAPPSRNAGETTARALSWLGARSKDRSVFLWVHYYDPHEPYEGSYREEIERVDDRIGTLLAALPRDRRWIVAVTGDHGEALGDHGENTHGVLLYSATLDVPLIVSPAIPGANRDAPVGLIDVAPTLAEMAGLPASPYDGRSLVGGPMGERWLDAEGAYPRTGYGLNAAYLVRRGSMVQIDHGASEVYDLATDPDEAHDLAASQPAFVAAALARQREVFDDAMLTPTLTLRREDLDALRSLGYAGSARPSASPRRVDLRRFVIDLQGLSSARALAAAGRHAEAFVAYDAFLAAYPASGLAEQERGQALAALGRFDEASRAFARALSLDPADAISALNLGNIAVMRGDLASAERMFLASLAIEEGSPEAHLNVAVLYLYKLDRPQDARPHLERFLALSPEDPEAGKVRRLLEAR
ncbi:MAG TPA: sulfatase-like hydrolase/transferase [Candidatus Polarisedimenticolaceae bacterium]|nr:sulfatase-like hydrolase/transferase [Candidatus Polarisedimenticolaceae bacterium]